MSETVRNLLGGMPLPKAWPFDEAARLAARMEASGKASRPVRDRVRPVRPAAYRHVRRGRAHHLGPPRLHRADRPPARLLAFSDDMDGLRKVPDNVPNREMLAGYLGLPLTRVPGPVRHPSELRRAQQRPAPRLPRQLRLRIRVRLQHRLLPSGRFDAALLRTAEAHDEIVRTDPADARAGAPRHLLAVPADPSAHRPGHAGPHRPGRPGGRHSLAWQRPGQRRAVRDAASPAAPASCNGRPTGRCAGTRSASITRCPART